MKPANNDWRFLSMLVVIAIAVAVIALGFVLYRRWDEHRVPNWVIDAMREAEKQTPTDILRSIPELRIVRTNPDGTTTDVTEEAIAGTVEGVNIGGK